MKAMALVGICLATLVIDPVAAKDTWHEIRSEHFTLLTNAGEPVGRAVVEELEKFRFAMGSITSLDYATRSLPPLKVYAYRKTKQYQVRQRMQSTVGYFASRITGAMAALTLEESKRLGDRDGREVIFHELTHYLLNRYSPFHYPAWYNEGFAEFVATMRFEDGRAVVGDPVVSRLAVLTRTRDWLKMHELAEANNRYIHSLRRPRTVSPIQFQYAQGWLITHFLNTSNEFKDGLEPYIAQLNEGVESEEAFISAFGIDHEEFDRRMEDYWNARKLPYLVINLRSQMPDIDLEIRTLEPVEADIVDSESLILAGRLNSSRDRRRARKAFAAALEAGIRPHDMRYYLARIAIVEDRHERAESWLDAILEETPDEARALTTLADLEREEMADSNMDEASFAALAGFYRKAIDADPAYLPARLGYVRLYLQSGREIDDDVFAHGEYLGRVEPKMVEAQDVYAQLLARRGEYETAADIIRRQITWADNDETAEYFSELLAEVHEGANATSDEE